MGLDGLSGIVGMSTGMHLKSDGDLIVPLLYDSGLIERPVFAFYLAGQDEQSYLDLGKLDSKSIRNPNELVWFDSVPGDFWWTTTMTGYEIVGADGKSKMFQIDQSKVMTDTGTSCSYIPSKYYMQFIDVLKLKLHGWFIDDYNYLAVRCDTVE